MPLIISDDHSNLQAVKNTVTEGMTAENLNQSCRRRYKTALVVTYRYYLLKSHVYEKVVFNNDQYLFAINCLPFS